MNTCHIGLGSNLQDPQLQLEQAVQSLAALPASRLLALSPVYRSAAVGPGEQPDYLNAVASLETGLDPHELLQALQAIENRQGRERAQRWGARTLDLDILLFAAQVIAAPDLQVPHPRLGERNFVLLPLADLCGTQMRLPDGTELGTLIERCPPGGLQRTGIRLGIQESQLAR